jgi:hypothetical protein
MRTRFHSVLVALVVSLWAALAAAAPEAHLLRVDPRASQSEGAPVLTTVVELVQNKRLSDAIAECAMQRGDAQVDCQSDKLEAPQALYSPIAPFPEQAAVFTVEVDGDRPAQFVSKARWGESLNQPGVGTAWLILIDAAGSMAGQRFEDAKAIANTFIGAMTPNDIVDVMFFNDRQVVSDSKWQPAAAKGQVQGFVNNLRSTYPMQGRARPLFNIIKTGATDAFKELGNVGTKVQPPLHQAMIVLSNGMAGADASSTGPATLALNQYLTKGRFPEDNTVQPKTPLPVIAVWLPTNTWDEMRDNAQQFMQGLSNPEIGGFYDVVRAGQGAAKAPKIVNTVRTRFGQMYLLKWRVSCIAPSVTQSFKLVFSNTTTPILGDSTFKDVPIGIDPTAWPLDINAEYTKQMADRTPVEPGGAFTLYGNFCWGGEKDRAEVYFVPSGNQLPTAMVGGDLAAAQRTQQQLIASGMRGTAVQSSDSDVKFEAPDKDKILWGSGSQAVVRLVVYDNKAHRASGVTATTVLTLKANTKSVPVLWIIGGAFGVVVLALLALVLLRGGGAKRRPAGPAPAPVVAGGPAYTPGAAAAHPYAPGPAAAQPPAYGQNPLVPSPFAPAPAAQPFVAQPAPAPPPNQDFMYGGQPPQYGLTGAQPQPGPMPPNPYGQAPAASASRATLTGAAGLYTVMAGFETLVGRDAARCQIVLSEPRVSAVHGRLKIEGGRLLVMDDGSNNGTSLDGQRIAPSVWTPVSSGSLLRFGPVEFSVRLE